MREGGKEEGRGRRKEGGRPNPLQIFENHQSEQKLRGSVLIKNRKNTLKFPMYYTRKTAWMCLGEMQ